MEPTDIRLEILPAYQLRLCFGNGSEAIIDMKQRIRGIRFGQLSSPALYAAGRLEGNEVVWENAEACIRASINELLDSMQMDGKDGKQR